MKSSYVSENRMDGVEIAESLLYKDGDKFPQKFFTNVPDICSYCPPNSEIDKNMPIIIDADDNYFQPTYSLNKCYSLEQNECFTGNGSLENDNYLIERLINQLNNSTNVKLDSFDKEPLSELAFKQLLLDHNDDKDINNNNFFQNHNLLELSSSNIPNEQNIQYVICAKTSADSKNHLAFPINKSHEDSVKISKLDRSNFNIAANIIKSMSSTFSSTSTNTVSSSTTAAKFDPLILSCSNTLTNNTFSYSYLSSVNFCSDQQITNQLQQQTQCTTFDNSNDIINVNKSKELFQYPHQIQSRSLQNPGILLNSASTLNSNIHPVVLTSNSSSTSFLPESNTTIKIPRGSYIFIPLSVYNAPYDHQSHQLIHEQNNVTSHHGVSNVIPLQYNAEYSNVVVSSNNTNTISSSNTINNNNKFLITCYPVITSAGYPTTLVDQSNKVNPTIKLTPLLLTKQCYPPPHTSVQAKLISSTACHNQPSIVSLDNNNNIIQSAVNCNTNSNNSVCSTNSSGDITKHLNKFNRTCIITSSSRICEDSNNCGSSSINPADNNALKTTNHNKKQDFTQLNAYLDNIMESHHLLIKEKNKFAADHSIMKDDKFKGMFNVSGKNTNSISKLERELNLLINTLFEINVILAKFEASRDIHFIEPFYNILQNSAELIQNFQYNCHEGHSHNSTRQQTGINDTKELPTQISKLKLLYSYIQQIRSFIWSASTNINMKQDSSGIRYSLHRMKNWLLHKRNANNAANAASNRMRDNQLRYNFLSGPVTFTFNNNANNNNNGPNFNHSGVAAVVNNDVNNNINKFNVGNSIRQSIKLDTNNIPTNFSTGTLTIPVTRYQPIALNRLTTLVGHPNSPVGSQFNLVRGTTISQAPTFISSSTSKYPLTPTYQIHYNHPQHSSTQSQLTASSSINNTNNHLVNSAALTQTHILPNLTQTPRNFILATTAPGTTSIVPVQQLHQQHPLAQPIIYQSNNNRNVTNSTATTAPHTTFNYMFYKSN